MDLTITIKDEGVFSYVYFPTRLFYNSFLETTQLAFACTDSELKVCINSKHSDQMISWATKNQITITDS